MKYIGPIPELHGRTALTRLWDTDKNNLLAQFDYDDKLPAPKDTVLHRYQHGWHELPVKDFVYDVEPRNDW